MCARAVLSAKLYKPLIIADVNEKHELNVYIYLINDFLCVEKAVLHWKIPEEAFIL